MGIIASFGSRNCLSFCADCEGFWNLEICPIIGDLSQGFGYVYPSLCLFIGTTLPRDNNYRLFVTRNFQTVNVGLQV